MRAVSVEIVVLILLLYWSTECMNKRISWTAKFGLFSLGRWLNAPFHHCSWVKTVMCNIIIIRWNTSKSYQLTSTASKVFVFLIHVRKSECVVFHVRLWITRRKSVIRIPRLLSSDLDMGCVYPWWVELSWVPLSQILLDVVWVWSIETDPTQSVKCKKEQHWKLYFRCLDHYLY